MDKLSSEDQQIIRRCLDTIVSVVVDVQIGKFNVRRTKHPEGTIDKASVEAISECHNYTKRYDEENVNNKNDNPPSISNISEEAEQTKKPYNTRFKKKKQCSCGLANTNKQTNMPDSFDLTKLSSTNTFVPYQIKWKSPTCQDVGICMCQTTDEVEKQLTTHTAENNEACTLGEKSNSSGKQRSLLPYLVNQKSEERGLSLLEEEETQILHYPWLRYRRSQTREITSSENNFGYSVVQERGIQTMYADLPTDDEGEDERTSGYLMESDIRSTANSVLMEEGKEENNKTQFSFEDQKMNYSNASDDGGEKMEISEENQSCSDEDLTQQPIELEYVNDEELTQQPIKIEYINDEDLNQQPIKIEYINDEDLTQQAIKIEYINDEKIVLDSAEICWPKLNSGIILMEPNPDDWTNLKHDYEYSTTLVNAYNSITKSDNYKYDYEQFGTEMPPATNEKALPDISIEEENLMSIVDHQNETQIDSLEDTEEFPENPCKGEELTNKFICKLYKECKGREGSVKILHHCVCSLLNICIEKSTVNPISLQMKAKKVFEKCRRLKNNTSRSAEFEAFENDLFILPRKKTETKNKVKIEIEGLKDDINIFLSLNEKLKNSGKQNEISNAMIEQGCQTVLNETTTSDEEEDFKDFYELENHVEPNHLNQIKFDCEKTQDMSCIDDIKSCASGQTDDSEKMKIYTAVPIEDILKMSDSKMLSSNLSEPRNDFPNINMKKRTLTETHSGYQKCFEESINLKNKLPGKTLQTTELSKTLQTTESNLKNILPTKTPQTTESNLKNIVLAKTLQTTESKFKNILSAKTLQTTESKFKNILSAKTLQTTESKFKNILSAKTLQTTESNEINLVPIPVFRVTLTGDNYKYDYEQVGTEMPSATNEKALPNIPIEEENPISIVDHQNETQIDSPENTEEFPENPCKGEELTNKFICKLYKECKGMEGVTKILHHCVCSVLNICIEKSTVNPSSLQTKAKKVFEKCRRLKYNTSKSAEFEAFENDLFILPRKKTETKSKVKIEIEGLKDEINNLLSLNEKLKKRQRIAIIKKKRLYQRMNRKNALIEKLSKKLKTVRKIAESRAQELFETTKILYEKKKTTDIQKLRNLKSVESQTKMCLITLPKTLKHKETQCNTAKNDVLALSSQLHYWQCRAVLKTCHFDDDRPEIIVTNKSETGTSGSHSNQ
ncbi:uncharacterized protein LOC134688371 [Mytilus trossulus]|uniref:uncharacterized protein LOC134688371 n=1 Tax=Mytilus trossulus TaxID=6551 RepID=UPI003004A976